MNAFQFSFDGTTVVYQADGAPVGSESNYSTPVEGGPISQLSPPGDWAGTFAMTPDSGTVVYVARQSGFAAGAVLRGDGVFSLGSQPMVIPAGAELRTAAGEQLTILSGAVGNAGVVEASGRAFGPAEMRFAGALTNTSSTGLLSAARWTWPSSTGPPRVQACATTFGAAASTPVHAEDIRVEGAWSRAFYSPSRSTMAFPMASPMR